MRSSQAASSRICSQVELAQLRRGDASAASWTTGSSQREDGRGEGAAAGRSRRDIRSGAAIFMCLHSYMRNGARQSANYFPLKLKSLVALGLVNFSQARGPEDAEGAGGEGRTGASREGSAVWGERDRKSTRLNSSHSQISYAVFCLKKKKKNT